QPSGPRPDVRHGGLRRLLHDIAKLAGKSEFPLAIDHGRFGAEDGAANLGPGKARNQADFALLVRQRVAELDHSEEFARVFRVDDNVVAFTFLDDFPGYLAADVPDLAFQIADARFPSVRTDQRGNGVITELQILFRETCLQQLLFHQKLFGDFDLL